ncbi:MAG: AbrB/MazE/SpoVT family DNA-binding domain-containing protein [Clostridia bacterium]|nr:AbrB/MazE/SpoVT family DNA-binding domain-containing protein [Clostridia bacterium]
MKATGIVRRIDDLGRVVIPKEIRRTMRIREGDPLEIYTDSGGEVIFKKYSPMGELSAFASEYADALSGGTKLGVLICDRDHCIAAANVSKKDVLEKAVTAELEEIMENSRTVKPADKRITAVEGFENAICVASPIIAAGDITGAVVLVETIETTEADETAVSLATVAARFLGNQTE